MLTEMELKQINAALECCTSEMTVKKRGATPIKLISVDNVAKLLSCYSEQGSRVVTPSMVASIPPEETPEESFKVVE